MTPIETRKSAALEDFNKWQMQEISSERYMGDYHFLIQELLAPSPPVHDSEVDAGIGALRWVLNRLRERPRTTLDGAMNKTFTSCGTTNGQHLENLWKSLYYKAAQHPQREEFLADIDKLEKKTGLTVENALRKLALQDRREEWLDIKDAPIDGTPHLLAAYIVPSEEAAKHGSKPYWDFGIGRPIYPTRTGTNWTGIVGGNPSHFKYLEPPKAAK